jgi:hypothetical protein
MERKLRTVEQLPADQARTVLALAETESVSSTDDDEADEPSGKIE